MRFRRRRAPVLPPTPRDEYLEYLALLERNTQANREGLNDGARYRFVRE